MKKDTKKSSIKDVLSEAALELAFGFGAVAIAFGIALLLPSGIREHIDFDLLIFISFIGLISIAIVIALAVRAAKRKNEAKDIAFIYNTLKDKYDLTYMTASREVGGEPQEVALLKGKNANGSFELFKSGENFDFSVEYFSKPEEEKYFRSNPCDVNEAMECAEKFMSGMHLPGFDSIRKEAL